MIQNNTEESCLHLKTQENFSTLGNPGPYRPKQGSIGARCGSVLGELQRAQEVSLEPIVLRVLSIPAIILVMMTHYATLYLQLEV